MDSRTKCVRITHRGAVLVVAIVLAAAAAGTDVAQAQMVNPYAGIDWENVRPLHSFSHQHGSDPRVFWNMGFGHLPISNYYPSRPFYPLPGAFLKKHPEALGAPNAEQHSTIDSGMHFCAIGSLYTVGYGQTRRFKAGQAPIEHVFSGLNVFEGDKSPWLGVYRLDLRETFPLSDNGVTEREVYGKNVGEQGASIARTLSRN